MIRNIIILLSVVFALPSLSAGQDVPAFRDEAGYAALAYRMIKYGYESKQPVVLASAALILSEHPVDDQKEAAITAGGVSAKSASAMTAGPVKLIDDALVMAGNDSLVCMMLRHVKEKINAASEKNRGRKYSPFVQEYSVKPNSSVVLSAIFNGNETAEVFVVPYRQTQIELYIYNEKGKLVVSDKGGTDNCYSTFIPKTTATYKIEIRNRSGSDNDCLLMTN